MPTLYVFSGLPGSGKSSVARLLAQHLQAPYLRLDSIEAALLNAGQTVTVEGYAAAYSVAADNLHLGLNVVVDCVNPLAVTRGAWAAVAQQADGALVNIEVVCTDPYEHQRRVETRQADVATHAGRWQPPTWAAVQAQRHEYTAWTTPRVRLETASALPADALEQLLPQLHG